MCTAFTLRRRDGTQLFGRTLDWHESFGERILRTPAGLSLGTGRGEPHPFPARLPRETRYVMLGMGAEMGFPLYADGFNERGLCMAGLRFAKGAHYWPPNAKKPDGVMDLAPWEVIPCVLGLCADVGEAKKLLSRVRVVDLPYRSPSGESIPTSPLHWMIADRETSLVVEATVRGLEMYGAPLGVMTNDPPYAEQRAAYERFLQVGEAVPEGYTSTARFIRAVHLKKEAEDRLMGGSEDAVSCFFSVAGAVSPPEGATPAITGKGWQTTRYTCCMDGVRGRYFYTSAEHSQVREISLVLS